MTIKTKIAQIKSAVATRIAKIYAPIKDYTLTKVAIVKRKHEAVKKHHQKYLEWADAPHTSKFIAGPGPDAKWLSKGFDALYENRIVKAINGK